MNGAKRSAEAVGCQNASVGERSALEGSNRESGGRRSGSENVGLTSAGPIPHNRLDRANINSWIQLSTGPIESRIDYGFEPSHMVS